MGTHSRISFNVQKHVVKHPLKSKSVKTSVKMLEEGQFKCYMCVL